MELLPGLLLLLDDTYYDTDGVYREDYLLLTLLTEQCSDDCSLLSLSDEATRDGTSFKCYSIWLIESLCEGS